MSGSRAAGGLALAALSGAAVMTLEMLASRWLGPVFGAGLTTWSVLIAVTLLAGSLGAWWGGSRAGRGQTGVALPLLAAGTWCAVCAALAPRYVEALLHVPPLVGLVLGTAGIVFLPVFLLGAVLPALVSGMQGTRDPGAVVGGLLAMSTVGSLVGTLLTALVLIPLCGRTPTALALAAALLLAGARTRRFALRPLCLLPVVLAWLFSGGTGSATDTWETAQGQMRLRQRGAAFELDVNGITQARGTIGTGLPGSLIRARTYTELLPWMRPAASRALVVGLGGGITGRMLARHGLEVDTYEVDPVLADVVERRLGVAGTVFIGDGRALWRRSTARYDAIVLDAFHGEGVPAHLFTREAFAELKQRLTPRGVLCVHAILPLDDRITRALVRTLRAEFTGVRLARTATNDGFQDLYFFASAAPMEVPPHPELREAGWLGNEFVAPLPEDGLLLTDERSPLDAWHLAIAAEHRRRSRP